MPTYDYECRACRHSFDVFQNMSEQPLSVCPSCKKKQLRRLIGGGIGVIFKGSGFYVNDSRSKSAGTSAPVAAKDGAPKDGAAKTSETTSGDNKPATTESKSASSESKTGGNGSTAPDSSGRKKGAAAT